MRYAGVVAIAWSLMFGPGCDGGGGKKDGEDGPETIDGADGSVGADGSAGADASDGADGGTTETPSATTQILGFVVDSAGTPLGGVAVSSGGQSAASDGTGRFTLQVPGAGTSVLVLEKAGYAPAYRQITPGGAATASVGATLHSIDTTQSVDPVLGGVVPITDASSGGPVVGSVEVPPNAFVTVDGAETPTTPVQVTIAWVGPVEAITAAPVPLLGTDGSGVYPLISYGMVDITVTWNGRLCGLALGQALTLRTTAAPGDPESAGLFSADIAAGLWKLEGAANHVSGEWIAVLPHLSWWNLDAFYKVPEDQQCCVTFVATKPNGKAASGVEVRGTIPGGGTFGGNTEFNGLLCHEAFPCDKSVSAAWTVYTNPTTTAPLTFVPFAKGFKCGAPECEIIAFSVPCALSSDCPTGQTCEAQICVGTPLPGPDAGGTGDTTTFPSDVPGVDAGACVPLCDPGQCSDNGCGQPCMACPVDQTCSPAGVCVGCVPNCSGKVCGDDGCNGSCGICPAGSSCGLIGQCDSACTFCPTGTCNSYGFEDGGLYGWDTSGDVIVIPQLGSTGAPEGGNMLRLSTGLSSDLPSYAQKALCASPGTAKLAFQWRLFSEEFLDFCGSTYQDYFTVSVDVAGARTEIFRVTIDELCPANTNGCTTCGARATPVTKSDVSFDKGDVYDIPWQTATLPLPNGAAAGTMIFEVKDIGDSAYDTVVLIDAITLTP